MTVITFIFYALVAYCLMLELNIFNKTSKFIEDRVELRKLLSDLSKYSSYPSNIQGMFINAFMYETIAFIGLFSSQWIFFLILIALSMIKKKSRIAIKIDSFISILLILAILINKIHLHINVLDLIIK